MPVCGHGRHDAPGLAVRVVTLHSVKGLESISAAHHVETAVEDGYTKLQPPPAHGGYLPPRVPTQAVLLDACSTWRKQQKNVSNKNAAPCCALLLHFFRFKLTSYMEFALAATSCSSTFIFLT